MDAESNPCPHVTVDDHIRACIGGSVVGLLLIFILNARSISRFLFSRQSSSTIADQSKKKTKFKNGSEVDQPKAHYAAAKKEVVIEVPARDYKMNVVDHLIGGMLVAIMAINIYTRVTRGVGHWLVQPCHYLTALLIGTTYSSSTDARLFWFYLYAHWQGYFAFFGGDLSWYVNAAELYAFWLQHILMVLVPLYYLAVGRFNTRHSSFTFFLTVYTFTVVYHSLVLIPVGYFTTTDFDNMLCPFPGGEDLVGIWWREAMGIFSSPFAFLVCYVPGTLAAWFYSARDRRRPTAAATIATATKKKKNNNNKEKSN